MKRIYRIFAFTFLSVSSLAFLPEAVSAQDLSTAAPEKSEQDAVLQDLIEKMSAAIKEARVSKDTKEINSVIVEAGRAELSDADFSSIVAMPVKDFPDQITSFVRSAVLASGGSKASPARVLTVMQSTISAHPHPFSAVVPVRDSVLQIVGDSPILSANVNQGAIAIAEYAPDNPLSSVTVPSEASSTPASSATQKSSFNAGSSLLLPVDGVPVTPEPLVPASPTDGSL